MIKQRDIKDYLLLALRGVAMGTASVVPGLSAGTIALITNIFEELINTLKSFNITALKLLFQGRIKEFLVHINFWFLVAVIGGMAASIFSLAKILGFLFEAYPVYVWSFFFGLILTSVYFVGRTITAWKPLTIIFFIVGATLALFLTFMNPASQNSSIYYLFICGMMGAIAMLIPGISGSDIMILMGNYELIFIHAVSQIRVDIIAPVLAGATVGLLAFSHLLSWILKNFYNITMALLTGFMLGSVRVLWPWKNEIFQTDATGEYILDTTGQKLVHYIPYIPDTFDMTIVFALGFAISGIFSVYILEKVLVKK